MNQETDFLVDWSEGILELVPKNKMHGLHFVQMWKTTWKNKVPVNTAKSYSRGSSSIVLFCLNTQMSEYTLCWCFNSTGFILFFFQFKAFKEKKKTFCFCLDLCPFWRLFLLWATARGRKIVCVIVQYNHFVVWKSNTNAWWSQWSEIMFSIPLCAERDWLRSWNLTETEILGGGMLKWKNERHWPMSGS